MHEPPARAEMIEKTLVSTCEYSELQENIYVYTAQGLSEFKTKYDEYRSNDNDYTDNKYNFSKVSFIVADDKIASFSFEYSYEQANEGLTIVGSLEITYGAQSFSSPDAGTVLTPEILTLRQTIDSTITQLKKTNASYTVTETDIALIGGSETISSQWKVERNSSYLNYEVQKMFASEWTTFNRFAVLSNSNAISEYYIKTQYILEGHSYYAWAKDPAIMYDDYKDALYNHMVHMQTFLGLVKGVITYLDYSDGVYSLSAQNYEILKQKSEESNKHDNLSYFVTSFGYMFKGFEIETAPEGYIKSISRFMSNEDGINNVVTTSLAIAENHLQKPVALVDNTLTRTQAEQSACKKVNANDNYYFSTYFQLEVNDCGAVTNDIFAVYALSKDFKRIMRQNPVSGDKEYFYIVRNDDTLNRYTYQQDGEWFVTEDYDFELFSHANYRSTYRRFTAFLPALCKISDDSEIINDKLCNGKLIPRSSAAVIEYCDIVLGMDVSKYDTVEDFYYKFENYNLTEIYVKLSGDNGQIYEWRLNYLEGNWVDLTTPPL